MLQRLHVKGYKLFRDTRFELTPLTVLVGPNGSGKTALWEILTLLPELVTGEGSDDSLDQAWRERATGGFAHAVHWGCAPSLDLHVHLDDYAYQVRLEPVGVPGATRADTVQERLSTGKTSLLESLPAEGGAKRYRFSAPGSEDLSRYDRRHPVAVHPFLSLPDQAAGFRRQVRNWSGLRQPALRDLGRNLEALRADLPGDRLKTDGSNLPQVLLRLKLESDEAFEDVREVFQSATLSGTELKLHTAMREGLALVSLRDGGGTHELPLGDWPDGWKAFLLLVVALRMVADGGLVFIEEPENHLHAALLDAVLDQVNLLIQRGGQVLLSTHSMDLLNRIEDPGQLVLLEGGTARRPEADRAEAIQRSGMLLGAAVRTGALTE